MLQANSKKVVFWSLHVSLNCTVGEGKKKRYNFLLHVPRARMGSILAAG